MRRVLHLLITLTALGGGAATAQQAAERVHTVQAGETLSSIALTYLGSVGSWRQIYEANRDRIPDPDRIEAGLELRIPAAGAAAAAAGEVRTVEVATRPAGRTPAQAAPRSSMQEAPRTPRTVFWTGTTAQQSRMDTPLLAQATEVALLRPTVPVDAFYSAGWLLEPGEATSGIGRLAAFSVASGVRSTRITAQPFDRLHVTLAETGGLRPGDALMAFRVQREIKDVGRVVIPTGMLTVVRIEPLGAVVEVAEVYEALQLGDEVMTPAQFGLRAGVFPEAGGPQVEATIVAFQRPHELHLLGDVMFLDVGARDGITVGDEFIGYAAPSDGWAPEPIGRVQVVGVRDGRASARILSIDAPAFEEGLTLRLSRKMP